MIGLLTATDEIEKLKEDFKVLAKKSLNSANENTEINQEIAKKKLELEKSK